MQLLHLVAAIRRLDTSGITEASVQEGTTIDKVLQAIATGQFE